MAPGFLLWVSWVCFLLFDGSTSLPAIKGYGYPYIADSRNMNDDAEDEELTSPNFDQSNWQDSYRQPTGPVYTSYNQPVVHQPAWAPVQSQSSSFSSASTGGSPHYAVLSSTKPTKSPSFVSWQPKPVGTSYGVVDVNAGSSGAGGNIPHLVYEDVFQYPYKKTEPSSYGAGVKGQATYAAPLEEPSFTSYPAQPIYPSETESFPGEESLNFGQTTYQPSDEISWHPKKLAISNQQVEVPQSVSELLLPSYVIQSRNAYERARNHYSETMYSPEFPVPVSVSSKGVEGPAPSQPAAPKGAQNPQSVKW